MPGTTVPARRTVVDHTNGRLSILPSDMPQGHSSGPAPYRFLLVGGEFVAANGVRSHELGPAGCLARSLSGRTGHGTDVDLVVSDKPTVAHLGMLLRRQRLEGLDGLVIVVSPGRHPWGLAAYGAELRTLLVSTADRMPFGSEVTVVAAPPLDASGIPAVDDARYSRFLGAVASAARPFATVIGLTANPGGITAADRYRRWADEITDVLCPRLLEPTMWRDPDRLIDEAARLQAVHRMGPLDPRWETEFTRSVSLARAAYGTRSAALSVVDGSGTRFVARQGIEFDSLPRDDTICGSAVSVRGGLIVGDARTDARFQDISPVRNGQAAFYAGYPVESPDGQPVAVLCVFDPEPRPVLSQEIAPLRDFALAAQRRIWELERSL
ncbi:MAG: GAF domain-containing protein [Acidobacteria bacterium]|nr:GAF domain-containing protein [Acidobacteriota bacterium]